jgi:ADP-heptose:LPS heptosyltransferase
MTRIGVVRLDSFGDVLLTSPTVRAVAAAGDSVVMVCGHQGEEAARLLPGVAETCVLQAHWIDPEPSRWEVGTGSQLVARLVQLELDAALVLTSYHQSPLPAAVLLREAGVRHLAAVSVDYPGSLLDQRVLPERGWHEVERNLAVAAAAGYATPSDTSLGVDLGAGPGVDVGDDRYVVVHPGASVPTRSLPLNLARCVVDLLTSQGWRVVITGTQSERARNAAITEGRALDLTGSTTAGQLGQVLAGASAVVVGNTGVAHLAAAVGTPIASVFSPVVPWHQWRPWHVPTVRVGPPDASCAGTRARRCPSPDQHCLDLPPTSVTAAVSQLTAAASVERGAA